MSNNMMTKTDPASIVESVVIGGDLSKLTAEQRVAYYRQVCNSLGLNPLTRPFDYIVLNGKLTLYARKDATEQLREKRKISIIKLERELVSGVYIVTAYAQTQDGRQDSSIGAVYVEGLKGENLANGMMKAETKSKRRVTLSICGLGMLDETEVETIPEAHIEISTSSDKPENGNGKPDSTDAIYQAVVDAKLSENIHAAKQALKLCSTGYDTSEKAIAWMRIYRGWRDSRLETVQAAAKANAGEMPK